MPTRRDDQEPDEIGKPHAPAGERARDEERDDGGPRYGGGPWEVADERGDQRYGHARNDDADPSELAKGQGAVDDDNWPGDDAGVHTVTNVNAGIGDDGSTENGGQRAGFGRGDKPQKSKARTKPNPRAGKR